MPAGEMIIERFWVADAAVGVFVPSVTVTAKFAVPDVWGVPERIPAADSAKPAGRLPEVVQL